jgi:hypothetical protein
MALLERGRLVGYPRLLLACFALVLLANLALADGWMGGLGQFIGVDFVTLYAAGWLYRFDPRHLYDFDAQGALQASLVQADLAGVNPTISPPWVAQAYSALTPLALAPAFALWTALTLACVAAAVALGLARLAPRELAGGALGRAQALVVVCSTLPFVEGLQVGQNHGVTLLLATGVAAATLAGRFGLAGALAGSLIYKPQFALGFLILWCVWRRAAALAGFLAVAGAWCGSALLARGPAPFLAYAELSRHLLRLPWVDGFPAFLLVTPFGLLATLLPESASGALGVLAHGLLAALALGLAGFALAQRALPVAERRESVVLALLFPLLASPYALLHDLLILFPAFLVLAHGRTRSPALLRSAAATWCGATLLPMLGSPFGVALGALVPIAFLAANREAFARRTAPGVGGGLAAGVP